MGETCGEVVADDEGRDGETKKGRVQKVRGLETERLTRRRE